MYKYFIKQRRNPSRFGEKTYTVLDYVVLLCMIDFLWWIQLKFKLSDSLSVCVNEALEGPHCWVCTPFNFQWAIRIVAIKWFGLLPMACFLIHVEFDFLIAERVRLFRISFRSSVILLVMYWRNGSDYYLTLLFIACLFNDGVLRQWYIMNAFL